LFHIDLIDKVAAVAVDDDDDDAVKKVVELIWLENSSIDS